MPFTPIQVPLINGVTPSFAHIELVVAGLSFTGGFKSIKYKRTRKREKVMSNSPDPVAHTIGENEYEASAVIWFPWWFALQQTILDTIGPGYGDQAFDVNISYSTPGFDTVQDVLRGCHFDSTSSDHSAGPAPLEREIDLNPLKILFAGEDDLLNPLGGSGGALGLALTAVAGL